MIDYSITFPPNKGEFLEKFDRISRSNKRFTGCIETKDGRIYFFDFFTQSERNAYVEQISSSFPRLFMD